MPQRPAYVPTSTYRLQVHKGFSLIDACNVVPYLSRLGVDACYTSPYFTAAPGSTHGYDVCNHNEINPEVGGMAAHDEFTAALAKHQMRHLVDFVPNHMGIGTGRNAWWNDVLENGPSSPAAVFFDIDWRPVKAELQAKLLLPILGDQYGRVLERGELRVAFTGSTLVLRYFDQELPLNARQAARVYSAAAERLKNASHEETSSLNEFLSIVASLQNLPFYTTKDAEQITELQREKEVARVRLERLVAEQPAVRDAIEAAVTVLNGVPGQSSSFDALHDLLEAQPYRLAYWRTASHEINYRRFFDVNTLVGLREERDDVFHATHQLLGQLIADGKVHAVRIDHPDGLFDPAKYFMMLQQLAGKALGFDVSTTDNGGVQRPLYVVAEKILSAAERLPQTWAVHGTTGYNFLNDLNGLFVDGSQGRRMRRTYAKLTGHNEAFDDVLYASKRLIIGTAMASELNVLAHLLERISESNRRSRDFTLDSLRDVITEVVACFPVYRTYVDERGWTTEDRAIVERAIARARRRNPAMESSLFDFLREVVLPRDVHDEKGDARPGHERRGGYPPADEREARERLLFSMKLQQYTGPVQAKGLEDTAFYRYNVLLSLNEVGGDPSRFGRSVDEFHEANRLRAETWPFEMLASATHDTKLGEDVRARINVLSEIPDEWGREVSRWMRLTRTHRSLVEGEPAPDRADEYRFYQALVGVWPTELQEVTAAPRELVTRLSEYMIKAVKEAKVHTSWLTPNEPYEEALRRYIERVLTGPGSARLLAAVLSFQRRIALIGMINSLAQVTLKIGSPGVPDVYQGTDLWDLSLVDPDNRRAVDFDRRLRTLADVDALLALKPDARAEGIRDWLTNWTDGRIKLLVTATGLRLRRELPEVFLGGRYVAVPTEISVPGSAAAFARTSPDGETAVLFVAPRLCTRLITAAHALPLGGECWKTSRIMLPPEFRDREFRDEITDARIRPTRAGELAWIFMGEAFERLPVAMLRAI
jgi:(1->4)-alpha-D-glucan 1-alpha-D-glucosylmutase